MTDLVCIAILCLLPQVGEVKMREYGPGPAWQARMDADDFNRAVGHRNPCRAVVITCPRQDWSDAGASHPSPRAKR